MTQNEDVTHRWNEPNLKQTDVKRQHYVPKCFLESFTGPEGLLRVINLDNHQEFRTSPANAAVEGHYYDITIDGEILSTETWLARLESDTCPILKRLIADPDEMTTLSNEDEIRITRFLAALRFRTPQFRSWMDETLDLVSEKIKEMLTEQIMASQCRWSTILSVVNGSGKMSVHGRIDIECKGTEQVTCLERSTGATLVNAGGRPAVGSK